MIGSARSAFDVVAPAGALLGEAPVWDGASDELVWVDIDRGAVHRHSPAQGREVRVELGQQVGCAVPRASGGLMLALRDGFAALAPGARRAEPVAPVERDRRDTRMNDGACDRHGRFWAGTMSLAGDTRTAALYRLDPDLSVTRALPCVSISNGLGWSPDDRFMYHVDTPRGRVDVLEYHPDSGTIGRRRGVIEVAAGHGRPDGLTIDAQGGVWVALWGGGAVQRYSPEGRLDARLQLPVSQVTSCCFGDPDLSTLYVTTAARGLVSNEPLAGALFACRPGIGGLASTPFAG
jgi:sugar lactone lactonase YvrE